jgi:hypothetical protein
LKQRGKISDVGLAAGFAPAAIADLQSIGTSFGHNTEINLSLSHDSETIEAR